jgi:hypothetical protein
MKINFSRHKPGALWIPARVFSSNSRSIPLQKSSHCGGVTTYVYFGIRFGFTMWLFNNLRPLPIILHARQTAAIAKKIGHAVHT